MAGKRKKADWGKHARDYGDNPRLQSRDRGTKHTEESWERTRVKSHVRRVHGKSVHVKAYTRKPG